MRGDARLSGAHERDVWARNVVGDLLRNPASPPRYLRRGVFGDGDVCCWSCVTGLGSWVGRL